VHQSDSETTTLSWCLSGAAAALYTSLLTQGDQLYDNFRSDGLESAVAELESKGFVRVTVGDDPVVLALPPEVPTVRNFAAVTQQWVDNAPDSRAFVTDLQELASLPSIQKRASDDRATADFHRVDGGVDLGRELATLCTSARSELLVMQSSLAYEARTGDVNVEPAPLDLLRRGVRVRYLYDDGVLTDQRFLEAALAEVEAGVEAMVVKELPTDFVVADRTNAAVATSFEPCTTYSTAAPALVRLLASTFDLFWEQARPLRPDIGPTKPEAHTLTDHHHKVLTLLVGGLTNDAIARLVRVNRRTIGRRVSDLMDHFGVISRNELIVAAARRSPHPAMSLATEVGGAGEGHSAEVGGAGDAQ
jgi:DNA-binding NarL/FixJ family response regulator